MKIAIAGSSGFVGKALKQFLQDAHVDVISLRREVDYSPVTMTYRPEAFVDLDGVINLTGESVFGRWTDAKKEKILQSRVQSTKLLKQASASSKKPPRLFINASAIGYYGDGKDRALTEDSEKGSGFLASVVDKWEEALFLPPFASGTRVCSLRFGVILSPQGGALAKMLPTFRWGLGGELGKGDQWMSWVALEDVLGAIFHVIHTDALAGPINIVSPTPLQNSAFTKTLGKVLHRWAFCSVPEFAIKGLLGQMGEEMLLYSQKVVPKRLLMANYAFLYPTLESALKTYT